VFVHVWKTGGTSVTRCLQDELAIASLRGAVGVAERLRRSFRYRVMNAPRLGKHAYAIDVRRSVGAEFDRLFSFAFVRNPWDWLVSLYMFLGTQTISPDTGRPWRHELYPIVSQMDFSEFVRWVTNEHGLAHTASRMGSSFADRTPVLQRDWVADLDGRIIVDFVGRYEDLDTDFAAVGNRIGRPDVRLPRLNATRRGPYRSYYTAVLAEAVGDYFRIDVETFGYSF
jgi:Sulfotransferase family